MRTMTDNRSLMFCVSRLRYPTLLLACGFVMCQGLLAADGPSPVVDATAQVSADGESDMSAVEQDWIRQAEAIDAVRRGVPHGPAVSTQSDAAGAVDGVKDGKYAFHTNQEPNPWWQVDLGQSEPLARVVVYNRLDYAPGLHNADTLILLTSDDGRNWTQRYDNQGPHFGGISGAKPLEVTFAPGEVQARFVRLQIPSPQPIFLHLDEVEIYGAGRPGEEPGTAQTGRPEQPQHLVDVEAASTARRGPVPLPTAEVLERGRLLAADLQKSGLDTTPLERELDAVAARLAQVLGPGAATTNCVQVYFDARRAVRALAFANPLLQFDQLLFVKRFTQQTYPDICLNHMPWVSRPGGDLCVLSQSVFDGAAEPQVRNILNGQLGPGHVHGMDLWWDADRIVFGYARKKSFDPPIQPWPPAFCTCRNNVHEGLRKTIEPTHIFEVGVDGSGLRQLTDHHYWSDLDPTYLPDGQIAFVSERCGVQPAVQSRSAARRDVLQPLRDAAGRLGNPPAERQQGRRLPAALPRRRHDRLHALGVSRAEPDADPVAVVHAARRNLGRRAVQAAHERSLGVGGCPLDSGLAAATVRGDCRRPSHAGRRTDRDDQRGGRTEQSGGYPHRHAGCDATGGRHVRHTGG